MSKTASLHYDLCCEDAKWLRKLAAYYRDAFMNACHNQMEVVQENKELKEIIKRHIKQ